MRETLPFLKGKPSVKNLGDPVIAVSPRALAWGSEKSRPVLLQLMKFRGEDAYIADAESSLADLGGSVQNDCIMACADPFRPAALLVGRAALRD